MNKERVIRFSDINRDYNLSIMQHYFDLRFARECPTGYSVYKIQDKEDTISYKLANQNKLYFKEA